MRKVWSACALAAVVTAGAAGFARAEDKATAPVLAFKMKTLAGEQVELAKYQGQVLLMVNVASRCGATPQYKQLQALHEQYSAKGLVVMGFPCNQFGKQEPGTAEQITEFCEANYGVKFPLFEKVDVNGEAACGLYKFLTSKETDPEFAGPVKWNFEKFLIGRDGKILARFPTGTKPDAPQVLKAIETALAQK